MARGMANGEPIVSQTVTEDFRDGYQRVFGDRKPQRGRWIWDERAQRLVPADEYVPPSEARAAPLMIDRFMEGDKAPDGTDIGSRRKRKAWMAATGVADYADYKGARERRAAEVAAKKRGEFKPDPALREFIGRELYKRKII